MITIICFTRNGCVLAKRLLHIAGNREVSACAFTTYREELPPDEESTSTFGEESEKKEYQIRKSEDIKLQVQDVFLSGNGNTLLFIGAAGIAVRLIAPYLKDKWHDPAVLVMDEKGENVISLLSGHYGDANRLAKEIAEWIGARPIITTASDVNHIESIDVWAKAHDLYITDKEKAKKVASRRLDGYKSEPWIGYEPPEGDCLWLLPKRLFMGIGCKKGTDAKKIEQIVSSAWKTLGLDLDAMECVMRIASVTLKEKEDGLSVFAKYYGKKPVFYTPEELMEAKGTVSNSAFVEQIAGVDCVCERAACIGLTDPKLLLKKYAKDGVTVAIAYDAKSENDE